jgi:vanillate O-demethylase ferredoxin subunit
MLPSEMLQVVVVDRTEEAEGVISLELKDGAGRQLPPYEPGAHVDIHLPNGMIRQYSLSNFQPNPDTYEIAIGLAECSRGGSRHIHAAVKPGDTLVISAPRNNFALADTAESYVFIAGGIGITPIVSMIRWCEMNRKDWSLLYCARSRNRAAYLRQLIGIGKRRIRQHFDDEMDGRHPDLVEYLGCLTENDLVYCCGPEQLMAAVASAAALHPRTGLHFERFSASLGAKQSASDAFALRLKRSGTELHVAPDTSILETLEAAGMAVPFSCREGLCRTCETGVVSGTPEHRDYVLSEEERSSNRSMMICVSRCSGGILELDL